MSNSWRCLSCTSPFSKSLIHVYMICNIIWEETKVRWHYLWFFFTYVSIHSIIEQENIKAFLFYFLFSTLNIDAVHYWLVCLTFLLQFYNWVATHVFRFIKNRLNNYFFFLNPMTCKLALWNETSTNVLHKYAPSILPYV